MANPFKSAPEEVVRYFDAKDTVPTWGWLDFSAPEHVLSFTVAKTAGYDVIDDLRAATQKAIADYQSYGDFVDELEPILRKKGWWGRKVAVSPGGKKGYCAAWKLAPLAHDLLGQYQNCARRRGMGTDPTHQARHSVFDL